MTSSIEQQVRALIASARENAERGRPQEAERLIRMAEMQAPSHPLVLNQHALRALHAGDLRNAATLLEKAAEDPSPDPEILFNLATVKRRVRRDDEAAIALDRLLAIDPDNLSGRLERAALDEAKGNMRRAAMHYRTALQTLPPDFRPPAWLEAPLQHAREIVDANNRALETHIEDGLQHLRAQFRDFPQARFDQCVDTLLQKRRIFRQQPSFMYFPELPAIEFYDRAMFPWLDALEAASDDIRAELLDVLADGPETLDPYIRDAGNPGEEWRELNHSRRWGVYSLWREGKAYPEHIARCPRTVAALQACPSWDVNGNGPTALFSILDARTRIPPHTGLVNTRLLGHLALVVPPGCGFRVGGQTREWVPGKAFVFDDSINHEAWNDSDVPRAVLIFDIWSPFLNPGERELTRALTGLIGEFYGTMDKPAVA